MQLAALEVSRKFANKKYPVGHRAHVCCVEEDGCTQKSLHQILGILHCLRAAFSGVGVFRDVDQRRRLLPLKEVDDRHHVEEESESGVMYSLAVSGRADGQTLPAGAQHVDRAVSSHQVGEEG